MVQREFDNSVIQISGHIYQSLTDIFILKLRVFSEHILAVRI